MGLESGCDEVLAFMSKGTNFEKQKNGCLKAKAAGLEICCYYMPGLGGRRWSEAHAMDTGRLIQAIEPHHVRLRTCFVLEGTPLVEDFLAGEFVPLTHRETVLEIRQFLGCLATTRTELISDHRINLLMELSGTLPHDHARLLGIIDRYLNLSPEERRLFEAGRRSGRIRRLDQLQDAALRPLLARDANEDQPQTPAPKSLLYPRRDAHKNQESVAR